MNMNFKKDGQVSLCTDNPGTMDKVDIFPTESSLTVRSTIKSEEEQEGSPLSQNMLEEVSTCLDMTTVVEVNMTSTGHSSDVNNNPTTR